MRRTTALTATTLLGLALLHPSAVGAEGETCRGEAATMVGGPSLTEVFGTDGRDVIVTNGSLSVHSGDGDDLVCVTDGDLTGGKIQSWRVDAGAGNDVVDGTGTYRGVVGSLGHGSDRFEGGSGDDGMDAGAPSEDHSRRFDTEHDVLVGGEGDDRFVSGEDGRPNSDVLQGGDGDDTLRHLGVPTPEAVVDGGPGTDSTELILPPGAHTLDNVDGVLRTGGAVVRRWTSLEDFSLSASADASPSVTIVGGGADERFRLDGTGDVEASTGGGDDELELDLVPPDGSRMDGGAGQDRLSTGSPDQDLVWYLGGEGLLVVDDRLVPASGFEDAFLAAPRVLLVGTDDDNTLQMSACAGTVRGSGGKDSIRLTHDRVFEVFGSCAKRSTLNGGPGDDRIRGTSTTRERMVGGPGADVLDARGGDDRIIGGPGRDRADGGRGRDRCDAERERRCER